MGRHIRKMTMAEAIAVTTRATPNAITYAIFARCSVPRAPACGYGKVRIDAANATANGKRKERHVPIELKETAT